MHDISSLLKEAKPLYIARKKRNLILKTGTIGLSCCFLLFTFFLQPTPQDNFSWWLSSDNQNTNQLTYVENLGLPVDDYGLLMVS